MIKRHLPILCIPLCAFVLSACGFVSNSGSNSNNQNSDFCINENEKPTDLGRLSNLNLPSDYSPFSRRQHQEVLILEGEMQSCYCTLNPDNKIPGEVKTSRMDFFCNLSNVDDLWGRFQPYEQAYYYLFGANGGIASRLYNTTLWDLVYLAKHPELSEQYGTEHIIYSDYSMYKVLKYSNGYKVVLDNFRDAFPINKEYLVNVESSFLKLDISFSLEGVLKNYKVPFGAWNGDNPFNEDWDCCGIYQVNLQIKEMPSGKYVAPTYSITYDLDGGVNSPNNPTSYTHGEDHELEEPIREGYTFEYWCIDTAYMYPADYLDGEKSFVYFDKIHPAQCGNLVLRAVWTKN